MARANIDIDEAMIISDIVDGIIKGVYDIHEAEEKIDNIMYVRFDLNEDEILQLEKFMGYERLERLVVYQLGYKAIEEGVDGGYPDIRNQMLEVKVQDSPTIDLGKYSPQFNVQITINAIEEKIKASTICFAITLNNLNVWYG